MSFRRALPTEPISSAVSPAASPTTDSSCGTNAPKPPDPISRLDTLLEIYLDRLDTYQKLRAELSKNHAAGFLSLAHANRTANLGSGRRYGEEGYDERMKAGERVRISVKGEGEGVAGPSQEDVESDRSLLSDPKRDHIFYTIVKLSPTSTKVGPDDSAKVPISTEVPISSTTDSQGIPADNVGSKTPDSTLQSSTTTTTSSSSQATPTTTTTSSSTPPTHPQNQSTSTNTKTQIACKRPPPTNPLNWYGLLIPPSLRAAQTSFIHAIEGQVPNLATIQAEMADLEWQIRNLRREAGLARDEGTFQQEADIADGSQPSAAGILHAQEESQGDNNPLANVPVIGIDRVSFGTDIVSGRKRLSSSRPERSPRSRVLKLDG